jgi:WD40 repeat protein
MAATPWFGSRTPLIGRLFRKTGLVTLKDAASAGDRAAIRALACALESPDHETASAAKRALAGLPEKGGVACCEYILERDCPPLGRICIEEGYWPPDDTTKALFFILSGNLESYLDLDREESRPLLARGYLDSPWSRRMRIIRAVTQLGKPELLLGVLSEGDGATILPADFFGLLARRLAARGDWAAIAGILFRAPLPAAYAAACLLKNSGNLPVRSDREYWEDLLAATPETFEIPLPVNNPSAFHSGYTIRTEKMVLDLQGRYLATGFSDGTVEIWGVPGGGMEHQVAIGEEPVTSLAFHPSGRFLACGGGRGALLVMDILTGETRENSSGLKERITSIVFDPDRRVVYAGGAEGSVTMIDYGEGRRSLLPHLSSSEVSVLAAGGDGILCSGYRNGEVRCQDSGGCPVTLETPLFEKPVIVMAIGKQNKFVAAATHGGQCRIWDTGTGRLLGTVPGDSSRGGTACALSPGLEWFASGDLDGRVRLFSLPDGRESASFQAHREGVSALSFSSDGSKIVAGSRAGMIHIFDISGDGTAVYSKGNTGAVRDIAASYGMFSSLGWGGITEVRDTSDGSLLQVAGCRSGSRPLIASAHAAGLIAVTGNSGNIHLWTARDWHFMGTIESYLPEITAMTLLPGGRCGVVAGSCGTVEVLGIPGGEIQRRLSGHTGAVHALACNTGCTLCAAGGWDASIHLFTLPEGERKQVLSGHDSLITSVSFADRQGLLVSTSQDRTARLWDLQTGDQCSILAGHTHVVSFSAVSPDGSILATGSWDTTIRLWSLPDGGLISVLKGHKDRITSLVFAGDRILASGDRDGVIGIWLLPGGELIRFIQSDAGGVTGLVPGPGDNGLISSHERGLCQSWVMPFTKTAAMSTPNELQQVREFRQMAERLGDQSAEAWRFIELLLSGSLRFSIALSETPPLSEGYAIEIVED